MLESNQNAFFSPQQDCKGSCKVSEKEKGMVVLITKWED